MDQTLTASASLPGREIPSFALFGETAAPADAEFFHIEDIRSRSRLYNWAITPHIHRGLFQVVHVVDGPAEVRLDDRASPLDPPCSVTIPPGTVHAFAFRPQTRGFVVTCAEQIVAAPGAAGALLAPLLQVPLILPAAGDPASAARIAALIEHIGAEFQWSQPGRPQMVDWLLRCLLLLLGRQAAARAAQGEGGRQRLQTAFARFRVLVEAHYQEHWSVADYATALHVSESGLNRLCRAVAGRPAHQFVQERLLLEAKRKLTYIAAPAALIAYELGFSDPAYFARFFKKHTGTTPGAYRRARGE